MKMNPLFQTLVIGTLMASFSAITSFADTLTINGAGATFPYPMYSKWFSEYKKLNPNVEINYQSIGSGGGIRQLLDKTVDFGASDAPMTDEQLAKSQTPIDPGVCLIKPVTPSFPLPPKPVGHLSAFPVPTFSFHSALTLER